MFCRNCQTIIPDDSLFCENCGAPTGLNPEQIEDSNLVPEEAVEFEVTKDEEPIQTTSVPVDPIWWEPPEEENEPIDVEIAQVFEEEDWVEAEDLPKEADSFAADGYDAGQEESVWKSGLDAVQDWEPAPAGEPEDTDELEVPGFMKTAEPEAESKEETAKLYAAKAKSLLAGLGKHVHTGTGWAVGAAKEQFQQRKEGFTDRKEQREQQREQEKREKEREQERKERERQRELEQLQEEERRAQEKVIQQPGFWYGDNMPEPTIAFAHAVKASSDSAEHAPEDISGQTETAEHEDEHAPEMVEIPTLADISKETDLLRTPAFDTLREMEEEEEPQEPTGPSESTEPVQEPSQEPLSGSEPLQEPESLSEEEIEDKLAETTRYDWSKGEIEAAVAAAAADENGADTSDTDNSVDITDFAAIKDPSIAVDDEDTTEEEVPVNLVFDPDQPASIVEEDVPPDEPAIYRIQDFGPVTGKKKLTTKESNTPERKDVIKIVAVIVAVLLAMGIVAGVMLHQAHVRQMEEEAYQAGLAQAQELVDHHKYKKAEKAYLALIDERPEDPEPYLGLANMYIEQQRYVDAKALVKRAVEATGDEEAFADTKKELKILTSKKWKKAYVKVLEDHESDIRKYEEDVTASVAVCDVNGDRKPELFFFTKEYYGYGKLHIYTMVSGKAKEVDYECKNRGTQYHDAFYDVSANDSSYAIFNGSGKGEFQIYANVGSGGRPWDTTNEYKLNLKGGCKRLKVIEGSVDTTYGENDIDDSEYLMDDEPITYDKYIAEFRKVLDGVQQVILYNGSGGDQAVWDKIKPENVMCMTYDAMMVDLKAK